MHRLRAGRQEPAAGILQRAAPHPLPAPDALLRSSNKRRHLPHEPHPRQPTFHTASRPPPRWRRPRRAAPPPSSARGSSARPSRPAPPPACRPTPGTALRQRRTRCVERDVSAGGICAGRAGKGARRRLWAGSMIGPLPACRTIGHERGDPAHEAKHLHSRHALQLALQVERGAKRRAALVQAAGRAATAAAAAGRCCSNTAAVYLCLFPPTCWSVTAVCSASRCSSDCVPLAPGAPGPPAVPIVLLIAIDGLAGRDEMQRMPVAAREGCIAVLHGHRSRIRPPLHAQAV